MIRLPKIVTARLSALGNSEHPDADLLTSFSEGVLAERERDRVVNHLSRCAECRQVLLLAIPESGADALRVPSRRRTSWLRIPALRWVALAACVIVVAGAVLIHRREQASLNVQVALGQAPPAPAIQVTAPTQAAPERSSLSYETKAKARAPRSVKKETEPERLASANRLTTPPSADGATRGAASDLMEKSESVQVQAQAVPPAPASPARANQNLRARNSDALAKAPPMFTDRPSTETAASTIGGAAKLTDFRAPAWRLSQEGLPERSFAAGQWEKVQVDHKSGFRAIASLGMEVWIGGPGGLLYHSEDMGLNWTRVIPVSSSATLADDVTALAFADHLHGKLSTAGGKTWMTSDAGKTWEVQ